MSLSNDHRKLKETKEKGGWLQKYFFEFQGFVVNSMSILPVECVAAKPPLWTLTSDLKTINISLLDADIGWGNL